MTSTTVVKGNEINDELLTQHEVVILYFGAPWCGPCRSMSPLLEEIAEVHTERIHLVKINIDEHPTLVESEEINTVPVVKIYKNGLHDKTLLGAVRKGELLRHLDLV